MAVEIKPNVTELTLTANIYREDDQYIVQCVEYSVIGQGDTPEAAIINLKGGVENYLTVVPTALAPPRRKVANLVERVRLLEQAYAESIGEAIEPADIEFFETVSLKYRSASLERTCRGCEVGGVKW